MKWQRRGDLACASAVIVAGVAALVLQVFVPKGEGLLSFFYWTVNALAIGMAIGMALTRFAREWNRIKWRRIENGLPKRMDELGHDEERGVRILAVTLMGGETRTVEIPDDYHPQQDNGQFLTRLACPELFEKGGIFYDAEFQAIEVDGDDG